MTEYQQQDISIHCQEPGGLRFQARWHGGIRIWQEKSLELKGEMCKLKARGLLRGNGWASDRMWISETSKVRGIHTV